MRLATHTHPFARGDVQPFHRTVTLALVLALHILLLIMLLRLAPPTAPPPVDPPTPTLVELIPEPAVPPARSRRPEARAQGRAAPAVAAPSNPSVPSAALPVPVPVPVPSASAIWSQVIPLTQEQFAAADIGSRIAPSATEQGADAGAGSGDTDGPGTGPNGEPLYNAEWYRRPSRAELAFYLRQASQQTGWGMIACQTVPDNRVENCREIAQSPAASGLAGAVRQAAWQFRIRPPRIGGRPMVGAWVRIRIDYTVSGQE